MAHAYFVASESGQGIEAATRFAERVLDIPRTGPDLVVLRYGLFSIEDARKLMDIAVAAPIGERKAIVVSVTRFFHEAQNALLKLFEEPPRGVTFVLVLPSEGILLPTFRSRLTELLPEGNGDAASEGSDFARAFLKEGAAEREKLINALIERSRSDNDEEKQRARSDAVGLVEGLVRAADRARANASDPRRGLELRQFIDDLIGFLPLLHTRSAPLKLIFEHLLIVIPKDLAKARV